MASVADIAAPITAATPAKSARRGPLSEPGDASNEKTPSVSGLSLYLWEQAAANCQGEWANSVLLLNGLPIDRGGVQLAIYISISISARYSRLLYIYDLVDSHWR